MMQYYFLVHFIRGANITNVVSELLHFIDFLISEVWNFVLLISQVFPYGSVPLKTYLPDGDIDLTAFSSANIEESFVTDVHAILKGEENNEAAQRLVKDVHCIDAEVLPTSMP